MNRRKSTSGREKRSANTSWRCTGTTSISQVQKREVPLS